MCVWECVCRCLYLCVPVWEHVYVHVEMRIHISCLPQLLSTFFWNKGSHSTSNSSMRIEWLANGLHGSICVFLSIAEIIDTCYHALFSSWALGSELLSLLPSSPCFLDRLFTYWTIFSVWKQCFKAPELILMCQRATALETRNQYGEYNNSYPFR